MKILFKLLGILLIGGGCFLTMLGTLASLQGPNGMGGVIGGGIYIALGVSIIVINRKGYSW
jgi:hypothetical protein